MYEQLADFMQPAARKLKRTVVVEKINFALWFSF